MTMSDTVETALSADLSRALSALDSPAAEPLPELDLDSASLPRLDDFASVEEALSCSLGELADLDALGVLPPHMSLSDTLSPAHSPRPTPSNSSISSASFGSPPPTSPPPATRCCPDVRAALDETALRLKSAAAESAALRQRVAQLVRENRTLRSNLDAARAQAAAAHTSAKMGAAHPAANPMLLGLAHVSADVAASIAAALAPPQPPAPPVGKKRKRAAAGKTLACLVLMCGFFFGTPSVLDGGSDRTDANLPAVWRSGNRAPLVRSKVSAPPVRPSHCVRSLEQLAPPELAAVAPPPVAPAAVKGEDVLHEDAADVHAVERADRRAQFSYVMCRNSSAALEHAGECSRRQRVGKKCGAPQSVSLIVPAAALDADGPDMVDDGDYAEVLCNIVSVSRIPAPAAAGKQAASGVAAAREAMSMDRALGRVIASVPERGIGS